MAKLLCAALALLLCSSAYAVSIPEFQIKFTEIVANMIAVETQVETDRIPLLKIFESTLANASAALAGYTNEGAAAVTRSDFWTEMALNELVALSALEIPGIDDLKTQLCQLAAGIHSYAESQNSTAALQSNTPVTCFAELTVAQVWQQLLNDINAQVVDLEAVAEPDALAALQNITITLQQVTAGATLFAADAKAGVAAISNATDFAHQQIVALQESGALPATKATELAFVDDAIGAILNMVTLFEAATESDGQLTIAEADDTVAASPAPAPAARRLLK